MISVVIKKREMVLFWVGDYKRQRSRHQNRAMAEYL